MTQSPQYTAYQFGSFTLDLEQGALLGTDGAAMPLRPKSFALLRLLVENAGRLLSRDMIMEALWPNVFVTDDNVTQCIHDVRGVLGAEAQLMLRTLPRRGYRFTSDVVAVPSAAASSLRNGTGIQGSSGFSPSAMANHRERDENIAEENAAAPSQLPSTSLRHSAAVDPDENRLERCPEERRQLTVMACDVAGLAVLTARLDLEDLRKVTTACHRRLTEIIERYHGHVANYSADGVLAYFGYPQADEHDAERAIRAGLALVEGVPKITTAAGVGLHARVGIATGIVVAGVQFMSNAAQTVTAVGGTPNIAARLKALASADQIVIAASTRLLAGNGFELCDLGKHDLKGIAEPVHVWRVEHALVTDSRFDVSRGGGALTPLVGREEELDLLLRRRSQARDGEGQVVLLSGEPGIGKSRILNALRERLEPKGVQALRFQCSPYYVNSAFWPILDNFERTLKFARDETTDAKLDKLEALIVTQYRRPLTSVRFVASILSIPCEARYGTPSMTPQKHKDETLRTLIDVVEAAARKQPSVMLFEDVHWADPTTLEVLDLLIDRVKTVPLLVVLTHRPEFQSRWFGQGHVGALNLSKLTRAQSAAIVSTLTGGKALPTALVEQILARTDGVPLFVEELTRSILESGELKEAGDHYEYLGPARAVTIPATLRDSLMARLDRFMPVKLIAQIGAAIGRAFSYELLAAVTPMPQAQLDEALAQLSASGLASRRGTPPDATYTFKHALVQNAAYDSLLKSRRQELHAKIACVIEVRFPTVKTIEPEVLAHHLTAAGLIEAAVPLWQAAGERASKRMAMTEAIAHLNQGLELLSTMPWSSHRNVSEIGLRSLLGTAWMALKGWPAPEVWTSLHPALALAKSLERYDALAPILAGLFGTVLTQGRVAEALPWAQEMLDLAEVTGDADLLIAAHASACECHFWAGEFTKCVEHADKVLNLYDDETHRHLADILNQDPKTSAGIFASICTWMLGYPDRALRLSDEAQAHARQRGHPFDFGWALSMAVLEPNHRCKLEELLKRAEECERLGRENSLPLLEKMAPYGLALIQKGKPAEGIGPLRAGMAFWDASGGKNFTPTLKTLLAEATALIGDLDNALVLIDEVIAQVERPGWEERLRYAETLRLKGWMLWLKDDLEGAEWNFRASLDWARHQQAKSWELRTSISLARLWKSLGKRRNAYELLAPVYGWFTEGFDTKDLQDAKALLAELGSNPPA
jgi:class 3 adenylate cyclase/tetratricopeptide (TPR) repeat protein